MPPNRSLLIMGLKGPPSGVKSLFTPEQIKSAVEEQRKLLAAKSIDVTCHLIDPHLPIEQTVQDVGNVLRSKDWDGISIGFGVRGNIDLTDMFEKLVNLAVRDAKSSSGGPPTLSFATTPHGVVDATKRTWPEMND